MSLTDNKTKKVLLQNIEQESTPYSLNVFLPKLENYKPLKSKAIKVQMKAVVESRRIKTSKKEMH